MKTLKAFKAYNRKFLALVGMGLALVSLVACAGQAPASNSNAQAAGNQPNANVAPVSSSNISGESVAANSANGVNARYQLVSHNGQMTGIFVSGQGRATGTPDTATINLGVEASRDTVQAARDDAATAMAQVIEVLRAQGIADEDIKTSHFSIHTRYDRNGQVITGYQVSNLVTAKVRDLDNVGAIIDEVVTAGGELTRFQGISFSIENTKPLEQQAREAAVRDLRAKAEQLAQLGGVHLGELVSISESGGATPLMWQERVAFSMADAAAAPTPIMPGETEVVINLQATYAIAQPEPAQ